MKNDSDFIFDTYFGKINPLASPDVIIPSCHFFNIQWLHQALAFWFLFWHESVSPSMNPNPISLSQEFTRAKRLPAWRRTRGRYILRFWFVLASPPTSRRTTSQSKATRQSWSAEPEDRRNPPSDGRWVEEVAWTLNGERRSSCCMHCNEQTKTSNRGQITNKD